MKTAHRKRASEQVRLRHGVSRFHHEASGVTAHDGSLLSFLSVLEAALELPHELAILPIQFHLGVQGGDFLRPTDRFNGVMRGEHIQESRLGPPDGRS